jgi:hypothetical protein
LLKELGYIESDASAQEQVREHLEGQRVLVKVAEVAFLEKDGLDDVLFVVRLDVDENSDDAGEAFHLFLVNP